MKSFPDASLSLSLSASASPSLSLSASPGPEVCMGASRQSTLVPVPPIHSPYVRKIWFSCLNPCCW
jgi:hypothetical protein